jgi:hypothetical protein
MLATLLLALAADPSITYPPGDGPGDGKHLVFLSGDEEYRGEEGLPMLAKILAKRHGFRCTVLFPLNDDGTINPDLSERLSDPDQLDKADGIVMALRFRRYPDAIMTKFAAAVERGVPIVALRTSTHAFRFPANSTTNYRSFNDFGRKVLGENWVSHWGPNRKGLTKGIVEPANATNELLKGVGQIFGDSGVYETHPVADATILLRGQVLSGMSPTDPPATWTKKWTKDGSVHAANDPMMPVAWSRTNTNANGTKNRVLCTTLGAATDLESEGLRRLVINGVYWGFKLDVPAKANVDYVDPYKPTAYAFKGYRRGIVPADHAIGKELKAGPTK